MTETWYCITNEQTIPTPAVLIYPDRIQENIRRMITRADGPGRLRPHVKTHKLPQIVRMQMDAGINRFKCATVREAAMLAETGAKDILIAYPLYAPAINQLIKLIFRYPDVQFSMLIDNPVQMQIADQLAEINAVRVHVFLDLDVGMERTGIKPGPEALDLCISLVNSEWLHPLGLHVYDGHLNMPDSVQRQSESDRCFLPVSTLIETLQSRGIQTGELICGGTPTFPVHAQGHPERTLSPGTVLLWDWGYSGKFQDLDFLHAAVVMTRIVSKPGRNKLCLDLGHKAIGSEMPAPRLHLFGIPAYDMVGHSEEHLVITFEGANRFETGDCLYGIPMHICPTMALHDRVWAVSNGAAQEQWRVVARTREIDI
jgi:D-serine deaminase-like pyridoxal phosphate-dependent protein